VTIQSVDSIKEMSKNSDKIESYSIKISQDSTLLLAVSDFVARGFDSVTALIISDRFRSSLIGKKGIKVLERTQMDLVLKEQGFQQSGVCNYDACLIEMGQLLGIQFIVAGTVGYTSNLYTFDIRMIDVRTGEIIYSIFKDVSNPLQEVLSETVPQIASMFNDVVTRVSFAMVEIQSKPDNAKVVLNSNDAGNTPLVLNGLGKGFYNIEVLKKNYKSIKDTFSLVNGGRLSKVYKLVATDEFRKSMDEKRKKQNKFLIMGTEAIGCLISLGAGGYYELKCRDVVKKQKQILSEYNNAGIDANFSEYKIRYSNQTELFDRWSKYRNLCLISGGIFATGFTVTLFF
jgi:hypothetical protein